MFVKIVKNINGDIVAAYWIYCATACVRARTKTR